jgi:ATP-dependent RNA helicase SUPV3L1/SUV3
LKPAPRALAAQLWALAHDGSQNKGLDDLLHLAGSGRTSMPLNKEIEATLYRAAGYRVCGERAVRVDILERLADLIRPALAWREGAPGQKPPGAIAGGGFTIINSMTSLTGASGEDFASILRSLGYRLERRPKPREPVADKPPESAEPVPIETGMTADALASDDEAASSAETPEEIAAEAHGTEAELAVVPAPPDAATAAEETHAAPEAAAEPAAPEAAIQTPVEPVITAEDAASAVTPAPAETASAPSIAPAEPEMIDVWRPGRAEGRSRPHRKHRERDRHFGRRTGAEGATPAPASDAAAAAPIAAGEGAPTEAAAVPPQHTESGEPQRHSRHRRRHDGEQRFDRPRRDRDRDRDRPAANAARHERQDRRPDRREKAPDPNSPFAKLAALKAQLEAEAKERR